MLTGWSHILNWQKIYITHFKTTTDRHDLSLGKYHGAHSIDAAVHGSLPRVKSLARACYMKRAVHPQKLQTGEISWSTMGFLGTPPCFWINSILSVSIRRAPNDPRESFGGTGTIHHLESDQFLSINLFCVYLRFSQYWSHDNGTSIPPKKHQEPDAIPRTS
jgi:hypothetical protein